MFGLFLSAIFKRVQRNNDEALFVQEITEKLNEQISLARKEAGSLRRIIEKSERPTFSVLLNHYHFPYFIFRNNSLYFWSENSFFPKIDHLLGHEELRFVSERSGSYIVYKSSLLKRGDHFSIFFFIPLSREYSIENLYLNSSLNEQIFGKTKAVIQSHSTGASGSIYTEQGEYLFSISFDLSQGAAKGQTYFWVFILITLGGIFLIAFLIQQTFILESKIGADKALLVLLAGLILIRAVTLFFNFPAALVNFDLYNPKYYASSAIAPSLGDLIINLILALLFSFVLLKLYPKTHSIRQIFRSNSRIKFIISLALTGLSFLVIWYIYDLLERIFFHSQWSVDITENIDFNLLRIASILVFVLLFGLFLSYIFIFSGLLISINREIRKAQKVGFVCISLAFFLFLLFESSLPVPIWFVSIIFLYVVISFKLTKRFTRERYSRYLFVLICTIVTSCLGAMAVYDYKIKIEALNKQKFGSQLLIENDVLGEYLLNEAAFYVKDDPFIKSRLLSPFASTSVIEQKIKRVYLGDYFDKYDIKVYVFDPLGRALSQNSEFRSWENVIEQYRVKQFHTEYPNIFLIFDPLKRGYKRYLSFNKIRLRGTVIGYILIELKQKRYIPHSLYPELLVDKKFILPWENQNYSYAVFEKGNLIHSYGQFNYEKVFSPDLIRSFSTSGDQKNIDHYSHTLIRGRDGKVIIVSSEVYGLRKIFSNFSFLFLVLMFCVLIYFLLYSIDKRFKNLNMTFAEKIQIYLNLAFFLPLLIVSITTLSIIASSYKENLIKSFIKKAEAVSNNINIYLDDANRENRLEDILIEKSRFLETDVNLYDAKGRLVFSNQPLIYEAGLLSKLINPKAYSNIYDNKSNVFILPEQLGKLAYNTVYIPIKSLENGRVLGILTIPFFESRQEINQQLIEVLTTILNIFVSIFLVFLVLSFLVSKILTVPLQMITQKLRRTTLSGYNEPLEWSSKDEIGMLVGEYNKMLLKLEQSKAALSQREKESAWREMAQQVAHEIKNPLTPMKLSIQHLQRSLVEKRDNLNEIIGKSLQVLLDQVNTLNEIATSFSVFAKMPVPKTEKTEISSILKSIIRLHEADKTYTLVTNIPQGEFNIWGDGPLLGNIFSNLILNAVQSVPRDRRPCVKVDLFVCEKTLEDALRKRFVMISISDNGAGIPEEIQSKVFLPNFSTKYSGSGLGLAIAKKGVETAGGRIWFETIEGQGTTFFIELPLTE